MCIVYLRNNICFRFSIDFQIKEDFLCKKYLCSSLKQRYGKSHRISLLNKKKLFRYIKKLVLSNYHVLILKVECICLIHYVYFQDTYGFPIVLMKFKYFIFQVRFDSKPQKTFYDNDQIFTLSKKNLHFTRSKHYTET